MANPVAGNPIPMRFEDNDLIFGDVRAPQAKTFNSFWAAGDNTYVLLYTDRKGYKTVCWLFLESKANKEAAIDYLFRNTAMEANFVFVKTLSLLYPHSKKDEEDEKPDAKPIALRFGFSAKEEALQFQRYAVPTFSETSLKYSAPSVNGNHHLTLSLSDERDPIQKIKDVFAQIRTRFGFPIIKDALKDLGDHRFPLEPAKPKENHSQACRWDHQKLFLVHRDRIGEEICVANKKQEWPSSLEEMNQWFTDPESFQGVYEIVVKSELARLFAEAVEGEDEDEMRSLGAAIDSIPGFREDLLSDLKKQQAGSQ